MKKNYDSQNKLVEPAQLSSFSPLVLFAVDANAKLIDDSYYEAIFGDLCRKVSDEVFFGYWKVLKIPNLKIEKPGRMENIILPEILIEELKEWSKIQLDPEKLVISNIVKYEKINGFAFVITYDD